jgi:hypothetical protein
LFLRPFLGLKFVFKDKNMNNLQSERLIHFPNANSLLKISLGLIFFTLLFTAFVYADVRETWICTECKTETDENPVVNILENAYLKTNLQYLDNAMFSITVGSSITLVNNDIVSHKFISGDVIVTDVIAPDESISIVIDDFGQFKIIDPDYPWIEFMVYVFPQSSTAPDPIEKKIIVEPQVPQTVNVIPAPHIQTISVDVDGTPYDVEYTVNGMTITEIESDIESMSLIFSVDVIDLTGTLDVTLDRTFFDSIYDGTDDLFFILADGDESISEEIETTPQSRTLSIKVPSGTEELEIIGSVFENSKVLEPIVEEPIVEEPIVEEISKNQCGPGTILENNVCVLDQKCGPGTILEDGTCVLDSTTVSSSSSTGISKELIMSVTIAFVIAGIIGIILALISRANRNKN